MPFCMVSDNLRQTCTPDMESDSSPSPAGDTDGRRRFCAVAALVGVVFYAICDLRHVCYCGHFRHPPYAWLDIAFDVVWVFGLLTAAVSGLRARLERKLVFIGAAVILVGLRLQQPGAVLEIPFAVLLLALAALNLTRQPERCRWLVRPAMIILLYVFGLGTAVVVRNARAATLPPNRSVQAFIDLVSEDPSRRDHALCRIQNAWEDRFTPMILDVMRVPRDHGFNSFLRLLLQEQTGQDLGLDHDRWFEWAWDQAFELHPEYADFKAAVYGRIDPRFSRYFSKDRTARIRLDEVRWGGVSQDGIPPLRQPATIAGNDADYLADSDVIFGVEINGHARAYPKRILGHHELVLDVVGEVSIAGVYCTLCGTMIVYQTVVDGTHHELGTSGFLYRSNKLMFDHATQSLWSTLEGRPVIGPLADTDIVLQRYAVVTTTWGAWRKRHPWTDVLALPTEFRRDYSEGAAYRQYFATDELMFTVPSRDARLKNKDEVLGLVVKGRPETALAIAVSYLDAHPVHHDRVGDTPLVILTDTSGAARAYVCASVEFASFDRDQTAVDTEGASWSMSETRLQSADGRQLLRFPAHRSFWFGWRAAYEQTRLVR